MKSVFFLVTLAILISVVVALPTFTFTGSTQSDQPNVGKYAGIDLSETPCDDYAADYDGDDDPDVYDYYYVAFNIWIDSSNASFYFVKAQVTNTTEGYGQPDFSVYIYSSWNVQTPCQGFYGNGQFIPNYVNDILIFDGIWLAPGTYTILVTTEEDQGIFGIEFSPATAFLQYNSSLPLYAGYDDNDDGLNPGPAIYEQDYPEGNNCTSNDDEALEYNSFTWTASTSGYFDIYTILVNSTAINVTNYNYYDVYVSLYLGALNTTGFTENSCQSNFITGAYDGDNVAGLDYVWLNAGWNYTVVVSAEIYGWIAVQVVPSTVVFIGSTPSFDPIEDDEDEGTCTTYDDDDYLTTWGSWTFTAWYPVFVTAAVAPLNTNYWDDSFDADSYLYSGSLNLNLTGAPITCTNNFVQYNGYSVGVQATIGANYTVLIADDDDEEYSDPFDIYLNSAVHLFVFTGPYVNTASFVVTPGTPSSSTSSGSGVVSSGGAATTGSVSSGSVSSTGAVTPGTSGTTGTTGTPRGTTGAVNGTTGVRTTGTTGLKASTGTTTVKASTGSSGSTTGSSNANDASSVFVSVFALLLVVFSLLF